MKIEVSIGEIIDKLSILEIKKNNIQDSEKLKNIEKEYLYLYHIVFEDLKVLESDYKTLLDINQKLWEVEDNIRVKESKKEFDNDFIELARSVYITNDLRAKIKRELNLKYNSNLIEEKSYSNY